MITIKLVTGEIATVNQGVWTVVENEEFTRLLNESYMQPPEDGRYAPSEDVRKAWWVMEMWGAEWVSTDESYEPGLIY